MRALIALAVLVPSFSLAQVSVSYPSGSRSPLFPFPPGRVETVNIVQWDSNQLPKIFQRSEQLPLTDAEVAKLSKAGFAPAQLAKMIEERRCACDASAEGLIRLEEQGVNPEVLSAISLHALAPNRALDLILTIDFSGAAIGASERAPEQGSGTPRDNFLYFFVDDGQLTRVFAADVGELLRRRFTHESTVDRSDLLLTREVRRIQLAGTLPLKMYGRHTLVVAAAARATLTHPGEMSERKRAAAQSYGFDYPRASLQSVCRLHAAYKRDPVLAHRWQLAGSRFECEFD